MYGRCSKYHFHQVDGFEDAISIDPANREGTEHI